MAFVLDASVAACWVFEDEDHPAASLALERVRVEEVWVPSLWWFEVRNILIVNERRGRLTEADTAAFLQGLACLRIAVDRAPDEAVVLALARAYKLTVYDASYLELAQRERLPLATLDKDLRTAAQAAGTRLVEEP
ncbi:type II toxin-antitoxin system VapC family toxin [Beijerinckia mobilis]|uniref:type II toxin-antitoxin system VapC family toxin n=1 Tax=Beijerinckia mobilis TaxID=231434 RepID=UPI00068D7F2C|nr:type II toxin-antitoxin system VapC family toxin [Beijerinckia mobilis]